jgi:glycosyltransferase involved in cell wall biosynthesis
MLEKTNQNIHSSSTDWSSAARIKEEGDGEMRILMVSQFFPPLLGGEERYVAHLSSQLAARGHQVSVATMWSEGLPDYEEDQGVRIYRLKGTMQRAAWLFKNSSKRQAPPFSDPELVSALRKIIQKEQPGIVHAHNWMVHSFLPLKKWSRARLVLSLHDYSLVCAKKKLIYQDEPCDGPSIRKCSSCAIDHYGPIKGLGTGFMNWFFGKIERRMVDMFLPVSWATAEMNKLPDSGLPFQVMPNFTPDLELTSEQGLEPYLSELPDRPFLLYAGALGRHKGVEVLLDAYTKLAAKMQGSAPPLVLIGYDTVEYPVSLEQLPDNVIVSKNWPHQAVMAAWKRCLLGVVPSTCMETFGLVAIEAMTFGRPVIASRIGGLSDLVDDGLNGFLIRPGDPASLADALERMIENPELLETMGHNARIKAGQYTASSIVPQVEAVYQRLLQDKKELK